MASIIRFSFFLMLFFPFLKVCCDENYPPLDIRLKGLVLIPSQEKMMSNEELEDFVGIRSNGVTIPGRWSDFEARMMHLFYDQPIVDNTIKDIKKGIRDYFEHHSYPFVIVSIPPQNITSGVLQVEVEEGNIGKISVEGNRWTCENTLLSYLSLSSGDSISETQLLRDVEFMNRNPFRRVDAIYSPGEEKNQTDITLFVRDQKDYHLYAGTDNTGVPTTGRMRYFLGLTWNQIFGFDHVLFYQFTTSQKIHNLQAHTVQYMAFLPTKTILNVYGGYSSVHAHLSEPNRKNSGQNIQTSLRHTAPLNGKYSFVHELTVGFDFKQTNNTIEFVDFNPVFGSIVNLTQFMAGYRLNRMNEFHSNVLNLELFFSPGRWLPHQKNSNFNSLRPGAKNHWLYLRGSWEHEHNLPNAWTWTLLSHFEWSSLPLLPSEQLGIGGFDSVRGYDERQINADTGMYLSTEIRTPFFGVFTKNSSSKHDTAHFLFFIDGGVSYDKVAVPTIKKVYYLLGAGPGMRYSYSNYLNARLDLGFKLHNKALFTGGSPMLHFSVIGNY